MRRMEHLVIGLVGMLAIVGHGARADGDAASGEKIFARCKACHAVEHGKNRVPAMP